MIRAVFFGTPAAALPTLRALSEVAEVAVVVTRPDKPRGRSGRPQPSPVKEAATVAGWELAQPSRAAGVVDRLRRLAPDVGVVAAYGQLLPAELLEVPAAGMVNVHFSLLPRWRGAAPVERAILAGDRETGVSLMLMDEGLDTGPVIARRVVVIGPDDTAGEVTVRLAEEGAALLREALPRYVAGESAPHPQEERSATSAPKVDPAEARLDPSASTTEIWRRVRAYNPRPGAWGSVAGKRFKIWRVRPASATELSPGWMELREGRLLMGTGDGAVELVEVQAAGRRRMSGGAWARGRRGGSARLS